MASLSWQDKEKMRPLNRVAPGWCSIAQSYGWYGGRQVGRLLRNTSPRSWYSLGTFARLRGSTGACAFRKHRLEHDGSHSRILYRLQSTRGRCLAIQGCPSTTGECGVSIMSREISSWWFLESFILTGTVAWEIRPSRCPLRERATRGLETSTRGTPHWAATVVSRKLSSALESRRADVFLAPPDQGHEQAGASAVGGIQVVDAH